MRRSLPGSRRNSGNTLPLALAGLAAAALALGTGALLEIWFNAERAIPPLFAPPALQNELEHVAIITPAVLPAPATSSRTKHLPGPFTARVLRVIDGDTFEAQIPIWFGNEKTVLVRLRGMDAPELRANCDGERQLAIEARQVLSELLAAGPISLYGLTPGKYAGRVIANVHVTEGGHRPEGPVVHDLSAVMIAGGYARSYNGGRRLSWC